MTIEDTIAGEDVHPIGYFVALDGIEEMIGQYDFASDFAPTFTLPGTFLPNLIEDSIQTGEQTLDITRGLVTPGDFSFEVQDTPAIRQIIRRKGGSIDLLAVSLTRSASQLTLVNATAGSFANQTVYIDRETIELGIHLGGGVYQINTRAAFNSDRAGHRAGQTVSTAPRHMMERRATLWQVHLETGEIGAERTGILTSPPVHSDGRWGLQFTDLQTVLNRPLLAGWPEVRIEADKVTQIAGGVGGLNAIRIEVPDIRAFAQEPGTNLSFVKIEAGGQSAIVQIEQLFGPSSIEVIWPGFRIAGDLEATASELANGEVGEITLRQVWVLRERAGIQALEVMLSDFGDNQNHPTWDVIPGRSPAETPGQDDYAARRIGAGLPSNLVDVDSFLDIPGPRLVTFLDEETTLLDFLTQEVTWRSGGFIYVNGAGQIAWQRWEGAVPRAAQPSLDVDDDTLEANITSWDSEDEVIGRATIEANYLPTGRTFTKRLEVQFNDLSDIYDNGQAQIKLRSKSLWLGAQPLGQIVSPSSSEQGFATFLDRVRSVDAVGGLRIKRRIPWSRTPDIKVAGLFSYTDARIPDHRGGFGVSINAQVIARSTDHENGEALITAREVPRAFWIAPAMFVAGYNPGTLTITVDLTGPEADLFAGLNPGQFLNTDWSIRLYQASTIWAGGWVRQVATVGPSSVQLSAAPPFDPVVGDLIVLSDILPGDTGNLNVLDADVEDYAFGADAALEVGGGARTGPPWG